MTRVSGRALRGARAVKQTTRAAARNTLATLGGRYYTEARRRAAKPVLSVVVPVYNVEKYLRDCIDSVLSQTLADLEVILVDDGSTDSCPQILQAYAARDHRVRVFSQSNSGQGIARNLGVTHARGEFLTFLDADDTVPRRAYDYMVRELQRTGSDFSVGSARRFSNNRFLRVPWARTVHRADHLGTTIDQFPAAMQDIIACNRMFRTEFWVEKVGGFRGHIAYEDHVPMLTAYVRARRFDVLSRVTYNWRIREDQTSTGQQKAVLENLLDRIAVKEEAHDLLVNEASEVVYDAWVARTLDVDFPAFVNHAIAGDDMYRNILAATYRTFLGRASAAALRSIRSYQKVRGWLVAESRWSALEKASEYYRMFGQLPPTTSVDGRVLAVNPEGYAFLDDAPEWVRELAPHETNLEAVLQRVSWDEQGHLDLVGWAMVRGLDASQVAPATTLWLEETETGQRVALGVEMQTNLNATRWARHFNAAYDKAGFAVHLDAEALVGAGATDATWRLHVRVDQDGVVRQGSIHERLPGSGATAPRAKPSPSEPTVLVSPGFDTENGFRVKLTRSQAVAEQLTVESHPRRLTADIRITDHELGRPRELRLTDLDGGISRSAVPRHLEDDRYHFVIDLPAPRSHKETPAGRTWLLRLVFADGEEADVQWPGGKSTEGRYGAGSARWEKSPDGHARVVTDGSLLEVSEASVTADALVLEVIHDGVPEADLRRLRVHSERTDLELLSVERGTGETSTLRFAKRVSVLGGPALPAPSGEYLLGLGTVVGEEWLAECTSEMTDTLPRTVHDAQMNVTVSLAPSGALRIGIDPPLSPDEEGITRQKALQRRYQRMETEPQESVLFQCYRGEFATDSQQALDRGLALARPDLVRYWGVSDYATAVPEGSVAVVIGSKAWYDVLASSRYLCNNIDFDGFFVKRPHQSYLQTFHGYPFKSMGTSFWRGKGYGPDRIGFETERRNREWDAILVPSEICAEFYRKEYDYRGQILVTGYPRTDFVVNADRAEVRNRVLTRLGVHQDRIVVLYAPTYRDILTTRTYAAKLFDELDLVRLTEELGERFVVLLRGHNNNQREAERILEVPNVVDVTDYPEVNELTVAADVAVLDYSSLRFEWALTGKPMLFFAPDLDDYFRSRPPLFDYRDSAPGPVLSTTQQVVEELKDVNALQARYRADIERFNAEFNGLNDGHATERVIEAFFR
jgi:CDP-glycerol glycerophosphotransferase